MNKFQKTIGMAFLSSMLPLSAAAEERQRDFQIPAKFFRTSFVSAPPKAVPVYCQDDFNWQATNASPTLKLMERIDMMGFHGGDVGAIQFVLMNQTDRNAYLASLENPFAMRSMEATARDYDNADNKQKFIEDLLLVHNWGTDRFEQIRAECLRLGYGQ